MSWNSWLRSAASRVFGSPRPRPPEPTLDYAGSAPPPPTSLTGRPSRLEVGVVSTVGRIREHNEDNFFVQGLPPVRHDGPNDVEPESPVRLGLPNLLIVADGMGGQLAGEEASSMAVSMIPRELFKRLPQPDGDGNVAATKRAIREAIAATNQEILAQSHIGPEYANMGTTVVLAYFLRDRVYVAGIGDSRVYRVRDGQITQLTEDHSLADALLRAGTIGPEEVAHHKFKNVLYLYLGSKDARGGPEEVPELDLMAGDRFLMASDGLTNVISDQTFAQTLTEIGDPQKAARYLVDMALENASKDNVTCMVIHVA